MPEDKDALRQKIDVLANQDYEELPDHELIGKRLRMVQGDLQFFQPGTEKVVQTVKRGAEDESLYYLVYGDGEYHDKLFLCPAEDFKDNVPAREQKRLSERIEKDTE